MITSNWSRVTTIVLAIKRAQQNTQTIKQQTRFKNKFTCRWSLLPQKTTHTNNLSYNDINVSQSVNSGKGNQSSKLCWNAPARWRAHTKKTNSHTFRPQLALGRVHPSDLMEANGPDTRGAWNVALCGCMMHVYYVRKLIAIKRKCSSKTSLRIYAHFYASVFLLRPSSSATSVSVRVCTRQRQMARVHAHKNP